MDASYICRALFTFFLRFSSKLQVSFHLHNSPKHKARKSLSREATSKTEQKDNYKRGVREERRIVKGKIVSDRRKLARRSAAARQAFYTVFTSYTTHFYISSVNEWIFIFVYFHSMLLYKCTCIFSLLSRFACLTSRYLLCKLFDKFSYRFKN